MNWIKEHEIDSWLLRGAVALMLLFPAFYSPYTDVYQSAYYAGSVSYTHLKRRQRGSRVSMEHRNPQNSGVRPYERNMNKR